MTLGGLVILLVVYSQDDLTDFDVNASKDAVPRRDVPFRGFINIVPRSGGHNFQSPFSEE